MRKFIQRIIIFIIAIVLLDQLAGWGLNYLQNHAVGGDTGRNNYICNQTQENILIFGSSKAIHHYDPRIVEDSLHMSCYNCGNDGNGIILLYGRYKMIKERYTPKIILYDVTSGFDLVQNDNHKYIDWLRPYYNRQGIDSLFWSVDYTERYKMLSQMYRYNSKILQLIADNFAPQQQDIKGYRPINKVMEYEPEIKSNDTPLQYDSLKLFYLEQLIKECNGKTQLIFFISPQYKKTKSDEYQPLSNLCKRYNVPLLNHNNDEEFIYSKDYFYDSVHLNEKGATIYTKKIIDELKKMI